MAALALSAMCLAPIACNAPRPISDVSTTAPPDRCKDPITSPARGFTVATFNIHGGRGRDGVSDLPRIADVVYGSDFVGMQEVSRGNIGDGFLDQPAVLAGLLGHSSFALFAVEARALWDGGGLFGNAFTTSLPVRQMGKFALPSVEGKGPRGLGWVRVAVGPDVIDCFIIHIAMTSDISGDIQRPQIDAALKIIDEIRGDPPMPCVFMGDFNSYEDGTIVPRLLERFDEVLIETATTDGKPVRRRDYIFVSRDIDVLAARLVPNVASDHPAIVAVLAKQRVENAATGHRRRNDNDE